MDPIFQYLKERGLTGTCDQVSIAGAIKAIAENPQGPEAQVLFKQIQLSKELHHIETVILMNHTDCGAYGGRKAYTTLAEEREKHIADMRAVREYILTRFSDLSIETVLADIGVHFITA